MAFKKILPSNAFHFISSKYHKKLILMNKSIYFFVVFFLLAFYTGINIYGYIHRFNLNTFLGYHLILNWANYWACYRGLSLWEVDKIGMFTCLSHELANTRHKLKICNKRKALLVEYFFSPSFLRIFIPTFPHLV